MNVRRRLLFCVPLLFFVLAPPTLYAQWGQGNYRRPVFRAQTPRFQAHTPQFRAHLSNPHQSQSNRSGWDSFWAGWEAARADSEAYSKSKALERQAQKSKNTNSPQRSVSPNFSRFSNTTLEFSYQPLFSPVSFSIDSDGNISVAAKASVVTPIGVFSAGAKLPIIDSPGYTQVNIRNRKSGKVSVYKVRNNGEQLVVVLSGKAEAKLKVRDRFIVVDVTDGPVEVKLSKE